MVLNDNVCRVEETISDIRNRARADLLSVIGKEVLRIEYNAIKRTFMKDDVLEIFEKRLKKYRNVLFEIFITFKNEEVRI